MPRRKKTFPCGHRGFGSLCHACRDRELARERDEAARRDARAAKQAVLEAAPIPLDGLPFQVAEKTLEVIEAVTAGRPWQEFKGKKIETRRGPRIVVPLGWSYRLLFRWNGGGGLVPEEALSHDPSLVDDRAAPFEYLALRAENRNALPAATPTNPGLLVYRLADGEVWVADEPVSGGWKGLLSVTAGGSLDSVEVDLTGVVLGATPPTAASKGTTPAVRGYLFDDAAESLTLHVVIPQNFNGAGDLFLDLDCVLDQAEGVGDDIDWSADLVAVSPGPSGGAATKTSTAAVPDLTDIGANSGDGALHRCRLTLDHDDPDNPIPPGALLAIEIHRTDLAEVGGVVLVAARVGFPQRVRHERA